MDSLPFGGDNDGTQVYGNPDDWVLTPAMQTLLAHEGRAPDPSLATAPGASSATAAAANLRQPSEEWLLCMGLL